MEASASKGVWSPKGSLFAGSIYDPKGQVNVPAGQVNPLAAELRAGFTSFQAYVPYIEAGVYPSGQVPASGHPGITAAGLIALGFTLVTTADNRPLGCYWWQGPIGVDNPAWLPA